MLQALYHNSKLKLAVVMPAVEIAVNGKLKTVNGYRKVWCLKSEVQCLNCRGRVIKGWKFC